MTDKTLILMGNRIRHLIDILNLKKETHLNCIVVRTNPFNCYSYNRKDFYIGEEYRITKSDIKQIKLIYEITGDRETALMHLIKDYL